MDAWDVVLWILAVLAFVGVLALVGALSWWLFGFKAACWIVGILAAVILVLFGISALYVQGMRP